MNQNKLHHVSGVYVFFLCLLIVGLPGTGLVPARTSAQESKGKPLLRIDFDSGSDAAKKILGNEQASLAKEKGVGGSNALKVDYVGYDRGSKRVISVIDLPRTLNHATLHFDVLFPPDFQFVRGGKLHGFGPANRVTGGGNITPAGWSARMMFKENGRMATYTYCHNKDTKWGRGGQDTHPFSFDNYRGRYMTVTLYVRLNHPPTEKNGLSMIFINGKHVHVDNNIQFRTVDHEKSKIQTFLFSTFHGGSGKKWAPKDDRGDFTTVSAYFDNFEVYAGKHVRKPASDRNR